MAEGAYLAAKAAGRDADIAFIGMDGLPIPSGGIQAVIDGRLAATLIYPTGGREAMEAANTLLNDCGDVEKEQILQTELVTPENAEEIYTRNATAE